MPIFRRKNETETIREIVSEIVKATNNMASTPYASAAPYASTPNEPTAGQGLIQTPGFQANPLPRMGDAFGSQLGPAAPFLPAPLDPVDPETGRALPRLYEYPVAWNLNLTNQNVPWGVLRALADQCDVVHRCIEIVISTITKMDWSFTVDPTVVTEIMNERNVSHAKAMNIAREQYGNELDRLRKFWENPYPDLGRGWVEWITEFLWQHLTFDGTPVYARYTLGGDVLGFEIIDSPTIKVLLDNRGAVPTPPNPAYQQILWGFPRGEYQATAEADGEFYNAPGKSGEFLKDQLSYFVRNRRTWSPYGFSSVEEVVPAATWYLNRQTWLLSEYTTGTMPMTFMVTDSDEMDVRKLAEFERVFNDKLMGSNSERHRVKVLPKGFHPQAMPTIDERYKSDYDEFIIKRIGSAFGVSPSQLGVVPRSGLGGAGEHQGEMDQAQTITQKPLVNFLTDMVNNLCRRYLGADKNVTFVLHDQALTQNEEMQAKTFQVAINSGQRTLNDVRGELGLPLYEMPEADEPFIVTPQGPMFLKGTLITDNGETVEQKDEKDGGLLHLQDQKDQAQESQTAQGESPQGAKPEKSVSSSREAHAELVAFGKFVKARVSKGVWRDFTFVHINEDDAYELNQNAQALVKAEGYTPPQNVQDAAQRALDWIADGKAGSGFTDVGRKRASDLARGASVSITTLRRMKAYFDRHQSDKDSPHWDEPSPGKVAWYAWGGDAGYAWAKRVLGEEKAADPDPFYPSR